MDNNAATINQINLLIVSPEGEVFSGPADEAVFPTVLGEIAVLPGHMPIFTKLSEGEVLIKKGGEETSVTITGGFLEVTEGKVNVLADYAIRSDEIEIEKAEQARKRAEDALRSEKGLTLAEKELKKSMLELKIADKYRRRVKKR